MPDGANCGKSAIGRSRSIRLWSLASFAIFGSVLLLLVAATRIRSRSQAIADAAPPERAVLTEEVERRVLEVELVTRGTVMARDSVAVEALPPAGSVPIVSALPYSRGQEVELGRAVAEVAGRPVIALLGAIPAYRDLHVGDSGADVRQLEVALAHLGREVGPVDGVFDEKLAAAVSATWNDAGYEVASNLVSTDPPTTESDAPLPPATVLVPRGEVVFVRAVPVRVEAVFVAVGREAEDGRVLSLAAGPLAVTCSLDERDAAAVGAGTAVEAFDDARGRRFRGKVIDVGIPTTDPETGARRVPIRVEVEQQLPAELLGADLRVTTRTARTRGRVLVVPSSALYSTSDGGTYVIAVRRGEQQEVRVAVGLSSGGHFEVSPLPPDQLIAGDAVVVGR